MTRIATKRALRRFRNSLPAAGVLLCLTLTAPALRAEPIQEKGDLALDSIRGAHFHLEGLPGDRVKANVDRWLTPCPKNNPGLLDMFARRDAGGGTEPGALGRRVRGQVPHFGRPGHAHVRRSQAERDPPRRRRSPLPTAGRRRLPRPVAQRRAAPRPLGPVGTLPCHARADAVARAHRRPAGRRGRERIADLVCNTCLDTRLPRARTPARPR